jgi:asparagine synthase (glutamine-hydrolysing)
MLARYFGSTGRQFQMQGCAGAGVVAGPEPAAVRLGYGWIDGLKAQAEAYVSGAMFAQAELRFPINPPQTKEAYWYRELFEREFPGEACARTVPGGKSIACSSPAAIAWDPAFAKAADPSGRAVAGVHVAAA